MTAAWAKHVAANPRFKFTAKLYKAFTHERNATATDEREFKDGIDPLMDANRLGALLIQFPISFRNTPESRDNLMGLHRRLRSTPLCSKCAMRRGTIQ